MQRLSFRLLGIAALMMPLTSAVASCSSCSAEGGSCMQPGLYLYTGALPAGASVQTCVDGDCNTGEVGAPPDQSTSDVGSLIQDQRALPAGEDVKVSIKVLGLDGSVLGQLDETRKVPDGTSECTCEVLIYQWGQDNRVERFAQK